MLRRDHKVIEIASLRINRHKADQFAIALRNDNIGDRYKLLLVPRLATVLTFVIGCLAVLALMGARLGFHHVLSAGLLPMVILTMTIERFFVVAEESGGAAALRMAASTGAVAAITYGILSWEYLQLLFFTYPELLLVVAAGQVALGRYLGYRLTELWRFRRLAEEAT